MPTRERRESGEGPRRGVAEPPTVLLFRGVNPAATSPAMATPRLLYVVTEDWYFLSHRLPMARAAKAAGYDVHVATRIKEGRMVIEKEGFTPHALSWSRGSLSAFGSLAAVLELRRLFHKLDPDILHNVSLKPVLLGTAASLGLSDTAVVNSVTGLGTLFIGEAKVSEISRRAVRFALRHLLRRPRSKTVVQNPDDRAFVIALGAPEETVVLIPGSGVDTKLLTPLPEPPPPVTAAYIGRMLADKGVHILIQALAWPRRRYPRCVEARAFCCACLASRGLAEKSARSRRLRACHGGHRRTRLPRDRDRRK